MQQWIKIRQELNNKLKKQVRNLIGEDTADLRKYQAQYEAEFNKKWKIIQRAELIQACESVKVIFMGDFHALQQSQKAHLRVLNSLSRKNQQVLAVEFLQAKDQKWIDAYCAGKINEKEFLKKISWQQQWGFPWDNYRPLLRWAIKNHVPVCGLDQRIGDQTVARLHRRDQFAATQVKKINQLFPKAQIIVIFGDHHLAEPHLPDKVAKMLKCPSEKMVMIYQNSEKIYFQLLAQALEFHVDVVRLKRNKFCILNIPPWVKWQNYLLYLEHQLDPEKEAGTDHTDHVSQYVTLLSKEFALTMGVNHFSVYSADSPSVWTLLKSHFRERDLRWFEVLIENSCSFYIPSLGLAYLAKPGVNHASGLAMAIVYSEISRSQNCPHRMPEDFQKMIWIEAVMYFGSKVINPKRKTDTLVDIKNSLSNSIEQNVGKEALRLALSQKMNEWLYLSQRKKNSISFKPKKLLSYREAARLLGGMLGEKLYMAYRKKLISNVTVLNLLCKNMDVPSKVFKNIYLEIIETLDSFPEPFHTKKEKL